MAKLRSVFKEGGSVTAGNASGLNDAASAVILMERSEAKKWGRLKKSWANMLCMLKPVLIQNTRVMGLFLRFKSV